MIQALELRRPCPEADVKFVDVTEKKHLKKVNVQFLPKEALSTASDPSIFSVLASNVFRAIY